MSAIKTFFKDMLNRPEIILVIIGLIMGSIMLLITPPGEVPDEPCHLKRTAEVADGVFFSLKSVATSYDDSFKTLMEKHNFDYPLSNEFLSESRMSFIMYIPSALGIKIADLILHDTQVMFYFGRLFNLISYILLCFFAIKITPVFKYPFMFCALLPMALFEGMSVSADSFNNGFAFLFFAFLFKLIFEKKELTKKDFTILTIFTVIGAFCKGLIYPILLSVFLPPPNKNFRLRNKYFYIIFLITLAIVLCIFWNSLYPKVLNYKYDCINDSTYIFKHPFIVFYRIFKTLILTFYNYIYSLIGILGWLQIRLPKWCYNLSICTFLSMFVFFNEKVTKKQRVFSSLIFIAAIFIIFYKFLLEWSSPNVFSMVEGVQGRYFIPLLPLIFITVANSVFKIPDKFKYILKSLIVLVITFVLFVSIVNINWFYYTKGYSCVIYNELIQNKDSI